MSGSGHQLKMLTASTDWREAFPVGNGAIGAMPYGRVQQERVLLNHERLWMNGVSNGLPDVSDSLTELRELMKEKKFVEANDLYQHKLKAKGFQGKCANYIPAGDLLIEMPVKKAFKEYVRELNMATATTYVSWKDDDTTFKRECFVSRVHDMIAIRITASKKGAISSELYLEEHDLRDAISASGLQYTPDIIFKKSSTDDKIKLDAKYKTENGKDVDNGREYGICAKVIPQGGAMSNTETRIKVTDADEILILIKFYIYEESKNSMKRIESELDQFHGDYKTLYEEHVNAHGELYNRTQLDIKTDTNNSSTEELLLKAYSGEAPLELIEKMANYGRYLLIGSSRPGGLPSNLQGIWNGDYDPPWAAFFMINENLQMNYWQSLPGQIPETLMGVVDFYTSFIKDFKTNAKNLFGCRGIVIPSLISPETGLTTHAGSWIVDWVSGAGWLAQHFYDYYLYTGDEVYLKERALPFLIEIAEFYEDFLFKDDEGKYTFCPSISPENWPDEFNAPEYKSETSGCARVTYNATMDIAIAKEVLNNLVTSCKKLNLHPERIEKWEEIKANLPNYTLNDDGAVKEWLHPDFSDNYHHRHQSHIYPVFPGNEIQKDEEPELYKAFKVAVDKRLVIGLHEQTGWSLSHMANINARLGDGDTAVECLDIMARSCLGKNFFTYHNDTREMGITDTLIFGKSAPFQIDANMGWSAAIYEMLLYSIPGKITLFPALPARFEKGSICNLRARGQFNVTLKWDQIENIYIAEITSDNSCSVIVKKPNTECEELNLEKGETKIIEGTF